MKKNEHRAGLLVWTAAALLTVQAGFISSSRADTGGLNSLLRSLTDILADMHPAAAKPYFEAAFGLEAFGGLGVDKFRELVKERTADGEVRSLAGHLAEVDEAAVRAEAEVSKFNDHLQATPDYSHLPQYCDQVQASNDRLQRIDEAVKSLDDFKALSQSYLRVLVPLEQMTQVMAAYWRKVFSLAQAHDGVAELTTVGIMTDQWLYWTQNSMECSAGVPCAFFLVDHAHYGDGTLDQGMAKPNAIAFARAAISLSGAAVNPMSRANSASCCRPTRSAMTERGKLASTRKRMPRYAAGNGWKDSCSSSSLTNFNAARMSSAVRSYSR